ncbi:MAG: DUF493 family protein [Psychrobium sp.]|nr:DUF493 family protein [Psychrobium sp.]
MDTNFDELLEFPCDFGFRIMGLAQDDLPTKVNDVFDIHVKDNYKQLPGLKVSKTGKYHSISYSVFVADKAQVEALYKELSAIDIVRYVL